LLDAPLFVIEKAPVADSVSVTCTAVRVPSAGLNPEKVKVCDQLRSAGPNIEVWVSVAAEAAPEAQAIIAAAVSVIVRLLCMVSPESIG